MTSKNPKETIVSKLGIKLSGSKSELEVDKLRKENALLKKTVGELSNGKKKLTDSERSKLLERILSLETLKERNALQILAKDEEMAGLRQQLRADGGEAVASLQSQLDKKSREAEKREKLFQALSEEAENVKNQLVIVSTRCQELENRNARQYPGLQSSCTDGQVFSSDIEVVQEHLRDALEKNQQWLVYDQQREAYVKGVLAKILELEQQLHQANHTLQQQHKEGDSEEEKSTRLQEYYDKLLLKAKRDLDCQKEQVARVQEELASLNRKYEDQRREAKDLSAELQAERVRSRQNAEEERKCSVDSAARLRTELESVGARLEEERRRSAELLLQVNQLQKSLLNQHEEQKKIVVLEQQIQMSAKDFENEKLDRQSLQQQLHKVLKELRKARDQIARLETATQQRGSRYSEPDSCNRLEFGKLSLEDPARPHTSPSRVPDLLDESFLECPKCRAQYPTSHHRELLAHIDYCMS